MQTESVEIDLTKPPTREKNINGRLHPLVIDASTSEPGGVFSMAGWIKIYRDITDHWVWKKAEYFKAWACIIIEANHDLKNVMISGELIECKRGQSLNSLQTWAKLFGNSWTMQKTRTFLNLLQKDNMICLEGMHKTTRLTVCNYDKYQGEQQTNNKQKTNKQQADNKQITINKNEKNEKNEEEVFAPDQIEQFKTFQEWIIKYAPRVAKMNQPFTISEYFGLTKDFKDKEQVKDLLKAMQNHADLLKKNISANLTFRNWMRREAKHNYSSDTPTKHASLKPVKQTNLPEEYGTAQ